MNCDSINLLENCLKDHLGNYWDDEKSWNVNTSKNFRRGLFALRDIQPNEVIFYDNPFAIAPTGYTNEPIICVVCFAINPSKRICSNNCGLPICEKCSKHGQHNIECKRMRKWSPKNYTKISHTKLKALLTIRLFLHSNKSDKILDLLQKNYSMKNESVNFLDEFEHFPNDLATKDRLKRITAVINTNAFKILISDSDENSVSARGIYPLCSLMNHTCTPNTRRDINSEFVYKISATRKIAKGEEIFTTYSQLLWNTCSRRIHLLITKQFQCICNRCIDLTECNTNLSALQCTKKNCVNGLVMPTKPIDFTTLWKCNECNAVTENGKILKIQEMAASMVKAFMLSAHSIGETNNFIKLRLCKFIPECNQFVIEIKLATIWKFSHSTKYMHK